MRVFNPHAATFKFSCEYSCMEDGNELYPLEEQQAVLIS